MKLTRSYLTLALVLGLAAAPVAMAQEPHPESPGPEDLAGFLDVREGVLHVKSGDKEGVLAALGAKPSGEDTWTAKITGFGGALEFAVQEDDDYVHPIRNPGPGDAIPCACASVHIYKNSICTDPWLMLSTGGGSSCFNDGLGGSYQINNYPYKQCLKKSGGGYCVHVDSVISQTIQFVGENCTGGVSPAAPTSTIAPICA
jgi:hypothetical protein